MSGQNELVRVYPISMTHGGKDRLLEMIPEELRQEARRRVRTPEEIAVIFAKISRNPGSFEEIAAQVDEEGAADFHQKWTVSVEGYGHASVGEHAVPSIAVENVSSEEGDQITDNRIGSYTEFSARFKGRQSVGFFTPESVLVNERLNSLWREAHQRVFEINDLLTNRGKLWVFTEEAQERFPQLRQGYYKEGEKQGAWKARLGKAAADQFKDMLPASRLTSIGVTWNATEAEAALRKLLSSSSASAREIGRRFKAAALEAVPTLVKYADYNAYIASHETRRNLIIDEFGLSSEYPQISESVERPEITSLFDLESLIIAAYLYESNRTGTYQDLVRRIISLDVEIKGAIFDKILASEVSWDDFELGTVTSRGLGSHDKPNRAFEFDGSHVFEFPRMTYGMWREYKRHRPQTYEAKPLHVQYGYFVSPLAEVMDQSQDQQFLAELRSQSEDGKVKSSVELFKEAMEKMEEVYGEVGKDHPIDARYAVTRSHYRPAIAHFSPREAFHLIKLRTGNNAHPFIRRLMWPTYDALLERYPNIFKHIKLRGERTEIPFP